MGPPIVVSANEFVEALWGQNRAHSHVHEVHLLLFLEVLKALSELLDAHQIENVLKVHTTAKSLFQRVEQGSPLLFK